MSKPLIYGKTYRIQNGYESWAGGYLDTRGWGCQGNKLCVSTATSFDRDKGSGSWVITSATGKAVGSEVVANDVVHLWNEWEGDGGYLDTRGSGCEDNHLCVSTADSSDRAGGSGSWLIIPEDASTGRVIEGGVVRFLNGYENFTGGFLDTRGGGCQDNKLCVSTSVAYNRASGSTTWRLDPQ